MYEPVCMCVYAIIMGTQHAFIVHRPSFRKYKISATRRSRNKLQLSRQVKIVSGRTTERNRILCGCNGREERNDKVAQSAVAEKKIFVMENDL